MDIRDNPIKLLEAVERTWEPVHDLIETMSGVNLEHPILFLYHNYNIPPQVTLAAVTLIIGTALIVQGVRGIRNRNL